ncbi:MAG: hypothetical protein FWE82_07730, partial [Defluviitaleaceae bacterium]|nr:hypothetical protein [Defluviitaleaceae bacterium]
MKPDTVYTTYSNGDGSASLKSLEPVKMTEASAADTRTIVIDETVTGRAMLGMGGTWTDTDVYNLQRMSKAKQDEVLTALFDKDKGAGWNFMRLPFGSTDWESTCDYYTYCDMPRGEKDWDLKNFSIKRDIGRGFFNLARRCTEIDPGVIFLASVWGVPGWMKENDSIMFGRFDAACTDVYAKYLRMAVQAYAEQGVKLHALTTQNEPLTGDGRATPACRFTWRMQKGVITALRREFDAHGIDTEIWIYDHNFDMADVFVAPLLEDAEARAAFDGVAFHDYGGSPEVMGELARKYPDIPFYMTERFIASVSDMDNLVQQLRNGAQSYIQWKTMTDEYSGPHQFLGRPFIYRRPTRQEYLPFVYNMKDDADDWRKAPSYGLYAQFTKFLRRGMKRVDCTGGCREFITAAAFADDKRKIVLVAVNQTDAEQPFTLRIGGAEAALVMPPQSVASHEIMPG